MGRDTIRLEDVVSTSSKEYLLEFTLEYGIPESLHPELLGLEEPIVEFLKGKVSVYTKFFEFANYHERIFPTVVEWRTNTPKDKMPLAYSYSELWLAEGGSGKLYYSVVVGSGVSGYGDGCGLPKAVVVEVTS
nr:hypothetical protein [Tanacetum cinerariifolium]